MSNQNPDLDKISPPTEAPPDNPDPKTEQENEEIDRRKALTPAQRADQSHSILIETLTAHLDFHKDDCEKWEGIAKDLQERLLAEKDREMNLLADNRQLKEITHSISLFSWLAYLTTVAGAISVGIAGSIPGLTEGAKIGFSWFGIGLTVIGLMCATYAHLKSKRANGIK